MLVRAFDIMTGYFATCQRGTGSPAQYAFTRIPAPEILKKLLKIFRIYFSNRKEYIVQVAKVCIGSY